jgi:hypothetical protein
VPRVDVVATFPHYIDHLAPIWHELPEENRGRVITTEALKAYAISKGMISREKHHCDRTHVLTAGWIDAGSAYMWDNLILMEHGVGQTYQDAGPAYAGGDGRTDVRLFLCPNNRVADLNVDSGPVAVIGDPYLDLLDEARTWPALPRVFDAMFAWHWNCDLWSETLSAWPHYRGELIRLRHGTDLSIAGTAHPHAWHDVGAWYKRNDIYAMRTLSTALQASRVFIADNTSAMWYAVALGIPLVVLNAPWYRRDVDHGLRFWEYADAGINVDQPHQLEDAIRFALEDPSTLRERAREVSAELFPHRDGKSARRAVEAISGTF